MKLLLITMLLIPNLVIGSAESNKIFTLTNQVRQSAGVDCLVRSKELDKVAKAKLLDMKAHNYFSHTSPTGLKYHHIMKNQGYKFTGAGENLAKGYSQASEIVDAWVNSPTHYKNLVEPRFNEVGIATDGKLTVQIFGNLERD